MTLRSRYDGSVARDEAPLRDRWERRVRDDDDVTAGLLLTALVVATYADRDGRNVRPTVARIARNAGYAVTPGGRCRRVSKHLSDLRRLGYLHEVAAGGGGRATRYELALPLTDRAAESTVQSAAGSTDPCYEQDAYRVAASTPQDQAPLTTTNTSGLDTGKDDKVDEVLRRICMESPPPASALPLVRTAAAAALAAGWPVSVLAAETRGFSAGANNPAGVLIARLRAAAGVPARPGSAATIPCPEHGGVARRAGGEYGCCFANRLERAVS
jgi:hypothetical protein